MIESNFPKRLAQLIDSLKISQKDFSQTTGISEASLSRYLAGKVDPTSSVLIKIAENTKVDCNWLLGYGSDKLIERMD